MEAWLVSNMMENSQTQADDSRTKHLGNLVKRASDLPYYY